MDDQARQRIEALKENAEWRQVFLETIPLPELIREISNRKNIYHIIGVQFIDGSAKGINPDTIFCSGAWGDFEDAMAIMAELSDYITEAVDDQEGEEDEA